MYKSFEICNSHAYGGSFLREPSMACNINGIGIANSKKYNAVNKDSTRLPIKLSIGFAMPQFVLSPLCPALPHLLANNFFFPVSINICQNKGKTTKLNFIWYPRTLIMKLKQIQIFH